MESCAAGGRFPSWRRSLSRFAVLFGKRSSLIINIHLTGSGEAQAGLGYAHQIPHAETRGSNLELIGGKAQHLVLLGPCDGQVSEAGNAHAMWKSTVNRRFDEIRCEERKRDRHIDLANAAPLAFGNSFGRGRDVSCKFIEPSASARN